MSNEQAKTLEEWREIALLQTARAAYYEAVTQELIGLTQSSGDFYQKLVEQGSEFAKKINATKKVIDDLNEQMGVSKE